jgi:hypothetical protein
VVQVVLCCVACLRFKASGSAPLYVRQSQAVQPCQATGFERALDSTSAAGNTLVAVSGSTSLLAPGSTRFLNWAVHAVAACVDWARHGLLQKDDLLSGCVSGSTCSPHAMCVHMYTPEVALAAPMLVGQVARIIQASVGHSFEGSGRQTRLGRGLPRKSVVART